MRRAIRAAIRVGSRVNPVLFPMRFFWACLYAMRWWHAELRADGRTDNRRALQARVDAGEVVRIIRSSGEELRHGAVYLAGRRDAEARLNFTRPAAEPVPVPRSGARPAPVPAR
jgi:hypothetical protein